MQRAAAPNGVLFSDLLNDKMLVTDYNTMIELTSYIHKLISLKLIDIRKEYDSSHGDDYVIKLNELGASLLNLSSRKK